MLTDEDLLEFQELCLEEFNLKINKDQAFEFGNGIINLLIAISSNEDDYV